MISASTTILNGIVAPVRDIHARVELYQGSTLVTTCRCDDRLAKFNVERIGDESKFFGFGICQRLNVHFIDQERKLDISTANTMKIAYQIGTGYVYPYPTFHVSAVYRDENTNELSITAYDTMYPDSAHTFGDVEIEAPYTVYDFAIAAAQEFGAKGLKLVNMTNTENCWAKSHEQGANAETTTVLREVLNDVAEVTQSIFYIDNNDMLVFRRLDRDNEPDFIITKNDYISLDSGTNRRLCNLTHTTDLGENLTVSTGVSGTTQFLRNNAFYTLTTNVADLLDEAILNIGGFTLNQFECEWRGNFLLEIGDKIGLIGKDNSMKESFILDDTIEYAGYLIEKTAWRYNAQDEQTEANPTNLGDALDQTFARVDKINKEISLVVKETETLQSNVSKLVVNAEGILAEVETLTKRTDDNLDAMNKNFDSLAQRVQTQLTDEKLSIAIQKELSNGVESVITSTGFTFDEAGLTIEKTGSEMRTLVNEDGMRVYRDDNEVLIANNVGVSATNLHATTFLIIGDRSRFEDYTDENDEIRTGCFWLGQ